MTRTAEEIKKYQAEQSKGRGKTNYFSLNAGDEVYLRIAPPWEKEGEFWKDVKLHGGYKNKVWCAENDTDPKTNKRRKCKIEARMLQNKNDRSPRGKKLWSLLKQNERGLWNVAVVEKFADKDKYKVKKYVDDTFKVFELSKKWHSLLVDIFAESDYSKDSVLGVAHPKYGRLIKAKRRGSGPDDTQYTFIAVSKQSRILEDKHKAKKLLKTITNLDKLVRGSSDEEISAFLHRAEKEAKKTSNSDSKSRSKSGSGSGSGSGSNSSSKSRSSSGSSSKSSSGSGGSSSSSKSSSSDSLDKMYEDSKKDSKKHRHSSSAS